MGVFDLIDQKFQLLESANKPISEEKNKESNPLIDNSDVKNKESSKIE